MLQRKQYTQTGLMLTIELMILTLPPLIPLRLYTLPYWSDPPVLIFDILPPSPERQSARMSKIKTGG